MKAPRLLDIAQSHLHAAAVEPGNGRREVHRAIAVFLAGVALEDALRHLCASNGISCDPRDPRYSIAGLQAALCQHSTPILSRRDNRQLAVWTIARNKAAHGLFDTLTDSEALAMLNGVHRFINRRLDAARRAGLCIECRAPLSEQFRTWGRVRCSDCAKQRRASRQARTRCPESVQALIRPHERQIDPDNRLDGSTTIETAMPA